MNGSESSQDEGKTPVEGQSKMDMPNTAPTSSDTHTLDRTGLDVHLNVFAALDQNRGGRRKEILCDGNVRGQLPKRQRDKPQDEPHQVGRTGP